MEMVWRCVGCVWRVGVVVVGLGCVGCVLSNEGAVVVQGMQASACHRPMRPRVCSAVVRGVVSACGVRVCRRARRWYVARQRGAPSAVARYARER